MIEIQENDTVNLDNDLDAEFFKWNVDEKQVETNKFNDQYSVLRHKVISSPIIHAIYKLNYRLNKPFTGLELESTENDGSFLTKKMLKDLKPVDPDSFGVDDFDDLESEMLKYTSKLGQENTDTEPIEIEEEEDPKLEQILVTVQNSSIKINNEFLFEFNSTVRSSSILKGQIVKKSVYDEDSLLITLTNGYFLLIRFYAKNNEIKAYVVQWWKTSNNEKDLPELSDVGRDIITHSSGTVALLTSMEGLIRLYYFANSAHGVMIDRLHNIVFDGIILNTCLVEPTSHPENSRGFIFTMVMTSHRRFLIRLFEWWLDESRIMEHTPLLLQADFPLPVLTIPLNDSVLLVMEHSLVLVKMNQILCANQDFLKIPYTGSFPVSYFKPKESLFGSGSEVVISTEDGTVYLITMVDNSIQLKPILKVPKITNFILEKVGDNTFDLLFSSDLSNGGYCRYEKLNVDASSELPKVSKFIDKWDNWAPLFSMEVVNKNKSEEIWMGHGKSLSKLKMGFYAEKLINDSSLRRAENVYHHSVNDEIFFIFSYVDKTLVFKYNLDELVDIHDSGLDLVSRTIHISSLDNICFQMTENSIVIADFENEQTLTKQFLDEEIMFADCIENFMVLLTTESEGSVFFLSLYQAAGEISLLGQRVEISEQPNFVKFFVNDAILYIVVGFENSVSVYNIIEGEILLLKNVEIDIKEPHDFVFTEEIIYISSRFGDLVTYAFHPNNEFILQETFKLRLTDEPIQFHKADSDIILISKHIWKLPTGSSLPTPIVLKELRDRSIYSALMLDDSRIALLRDDGFCLVSLSVNPGPIIKSIKLNQLAKKVKYLSHLKVFAILSETGLIFANRFKQLNETLFSKKNGNPLFHEETPLCISEWILPTENKSFRSLLVGCGTESGGSLKILQVKQNPDSSDSIEVYELFNLKTKGAVLSIQQLQDDSIIFSSGYELFRVEYNLKSQKLTESTLVKLFDSLIVHIDVSNDKILVSTKDYSMTVLRYTNGDFIEVENDPLVRKITNSLLLKDNVTITTDKLNCSITGVQNSQNRFRANVSFVPKLQRCQCLPKWWINDPTLNKTPLIRFIAYGISGDVQIYTLLDKTQTAAYKTIYRKTVPIPSGVTEKGFWEIRDGPWSNDRNVNTFDHDRFDVNNISKSLQLLIASVSL